MATEQDYRPPSDRMGSSNGSRAGRAMTEQVYQNLYDRIAACGRR